MLPEFIPDNLEPPQLDRLGRELSNEMKRLSKLVGQYEADVTAAEAEYKREYSKALVMNDAPRRTPTILKAIADCDSNVIKAADDLQQKKAKLTMGKAELEGRDKQYQMVKKLIDLKVQELRTFRG